MKKNSNYIKYIISTTVLIITIFTITTKLAFAATVSIIDTLDAPNQGENATLGAFGNTVLAQSFVTDSTGGVVTSLVIQDAYVNPYTTDHDVKIYSTAGEGAIGSPLISFNSSPANSSGLLTFTPTASISLDPDTMYWVVVKSASTITWKYSNTVNSGTGTIPESMYRAKSTDNGITFLYDADVNAGGSFGIGAWNFNMEIIVNTQSETTIEPIDVFSIGTHSATLQGHVENLTWEGDQNGTPVYLFTVATDPEPTINNSFFISTRDIDESGNFTISTSDGGLLVCETTYYVKAYVHVEAIPEGLDYPVNIFEKSSTNTISFTTNDCPSVELDDITNITKTGATLRARVQNKDWNNIDSTGFFSFYVDKAEDFNSEDQIYIEVESIDDLGYFSTDIPTETPLECGTTYYVMAQLNSSGTVDGLSWSEYYEDTSSFTTADCKTAAKKRSVGGYASPTYLAQQGIVLEQSSVIPNTTTQCPANQLLTQNLKAPSRNGVYNTYTKAIVTQAHILQAHLNRLGFNSGKEDGILGPISTGAIKRMQTYLGTTPDGYVGPITRGLLNNSCGEKGLQKS